MRQPVLVKLDGAVAGILQPGEPDQTLNLGDVDANAMMTLAQGGKDAVRYLVPTPFDEGELVYVFRVGKEQVEVLPVWEQDNRLSLRLGLRQPRWSQFREVVSGLTGRSVWRPLFIVSALLLAVAIVTTRKNAVEVSVPGGTGTECPANAQCFPFSGNEFQIRLSGTRSEPVCLLPWEPSLSLEDSLMLRIDSEEGRPLPSSAVDSRGCATFPPVLLDKPIRGKLRLLAGGRVQRSYDIEVKRE